MLVSHGTPQREHKRCNCKNSKCLKLYCECFSAGKYCDECNCFNCKNNVAFAAERREAVEATLERNPNAFRPKIAVVASPGGVGHASGGVDGDADVVARHNRGCHCKRSGCLKKYCECFQAAIFCHETCKCVDCKNHEGSDAYETVKRVHGPDARFHDHASTAMSPSPGRRRALGDGSASPGGAAGRAVGASPRRTARESVGAGARDGGTVPLMHNLVQQGAVEELARILLVVADETKASATAKGDEEGEDATLATTTTTTTTDERNARAGRSSVPSAGGVAAVAELAAAAVTPPKDVKSEPAADVEGLMCDETVSALGLAPKSSPSIKVSYKEQERALLGEFERVVSRLTQNAKARVEHARKTKSLASTGDAAKKARVK